MRLRRILTPAILLLVVLLFSGCASYSPIQPEATEVDLVSNGMVVVSAQEQKSSEGLMSLGSTFYFRNQVTSGRGLIETANTFTDHRNDFVHLENTHGSINAYLLPPGEYEFISWELRASLGKVYRTPLIGRPRRAAFTVKAGVIQYIGNIDMVLVIGKNALGKDSIWGG